MELILKVVISKILSQESEAGGTLCMECGADRGVTLDEKSSGSSPNCAVSSAQSVFPRVIACSWNPDTEPTSGLTSLEQQDQ
jgi:hypothetical protein